MSRGSSERVLRDNVKSILGRALARPNTPVRISELGVGSADKTSILPFEEQTISSELTYFPIDISFAAFDEAKKSSELDLPESSRKTDRFGLHHQPNRT